MPSVMWSILFTLTVIGTVAADIYHAEAQIEWVRSHGGFFSPKIELQRINKTNPDSAMGVFVTEEVSENETLMMIPHTCVLTTDESEDGCDAAQNLVKERRLKNESRYAPYLDYVFDPGHKGQIPSEWSEMGKKLLKTIVGRELTPYDMADISFQDECDGSGDPLEEEAYFIVIKRSRNEAMVPLLDMINHRNGHWCNVDSNSFHDGGNDITVFASRNLHVGEQLYLSYNKCVDCDNHRLTYVLPHILRDFGFVEQYPRRWYFDEPGSDEPDLAFELDEDPNTEELQLTWLSKEPNEPSINFLRGHLVRLQNLGDYVSEQVQQIDSSHERNVSLEYYQALMTALECALWASDDEEEVSDEYDKLDAVSETMDFNEQVCDYEHARRDLSEVNYEHIDDTASFYQSITFSHSKALNDTCLYMDEYLHTCMSFRPHYHEYFVHYPARFLDEIKRVAFIGGGDNMIVHEILKYPSLELAVGLELDQTVVRSSFKNIGTQPHFDDGRLQWWFGDAAKSLLMLPSEYFGSFDLVLIDLTQEVVDVLKVTDNLDINDAAMLLLKPDGVAARNEDWNFGTTEPFAKYTVDLFYVDVPITCHQGITISSNGVDFLNKAPKDHHVETLYLRPVDEVEDRYDIWYNYKKIKEHTTALCEEPSMVETALVEKVASNLGVLMVIEAEDVSVRLQSSSAVQAIISKALAHSDLTQTSVQLSPKDEGYELFFILEEGYVVARTWPQQKYCAFDLTLWRTIDKQEMAKTQLVAAVGSSSVSSYRIVTGGMYGIKDDKSNVGPRVNATCDKDAVDTPYQDVVSVEQSAIDTILSESAGMIEGSSVLVLCGNASRTCSSLEMLTKKELEVIPVWTWPSLTQDGDVSQDMMIDCERDILGSLHEMVEENGKLSGIVIDPQAPLVMGQILHKILSNSRVRREILTENHVVLSVSAADPSDALWRRALLDRFRTNFSRHCPSYQAEVSFEKTNLELGVFSSNNGGFYSALMGAIRSIEENTGLHADVQTIKNGINNYVADFEPTTTASHDDYNQTSALEQWRSQQSLAEQAVFQFAAHYESTALTTTALEEAMHNAIFRMSVGDDGFDIKVHNNVGNGCIIVGFWALGSAILTWNGRQDVSVNLVTDQDHYQFAKTFQKQSRLHMTAHDEMPRGIGRVVNFLSDYLGTAFPHWAS